MCIDCRPCDLVSLGRAGGPNVGSETTSEDAGHKDSGLFEFVPGFACAGFFFLIVFFVLLGSP